MGSYICDEIQNKYLRRFLRVVFFLVGLIPYVISLFVTTILLYNAKIGIDPTDINIFQILTISLTTLGGWATWFIFCKIFGLFIGIGD